MPIQRLLEQDREVKESLSWIQLFLRQIKRIRQSNPPVLEEWIGALLGT